MNLTSHYCKHLSAIHLSSDTMTSLPTYSSPISISPMSASEWPSVQPSHLQEDQPLDDAKKADQEDNFVPWPTVPMRHHHRCWSRRGCMENHLNTIIKKNTSSTDTLTSLQVLLHTSPSGDNYRFKLCIYHPMPCQ